MASTPATTAPSGTGVRESLSSAGGVTTPALSSTSVRESSSRRVTTSAATGAPPPSSAVRESLSRRVTTPAPGGATTPNVIDSVRESLSSAGRASLSTAAKPPSGNNVRASLPAAGRVSLPAAATAPSGMSIRESLSAAGKVPTLGSAVPSNASSTLQSGMTIRESLSAAGKVPTLGSSAGERKVSRPAITNIPRPPGSPDSTTLSGTGVRESFSTAGGTTYMGAEGKAKAASVLEKFHLPLVLFPLSTIHEFGFNEDSGLIWMKQQTRTKKEFPEAEVVLHYHRAIHGYIEHEKLKDLVGFKVKGMKEKDLFISVPYSEIRVDDDEVYMRSERDESRAFPINVFLAKPPDP